MPSSLVGEASIVHQAMTWVKGLGEGWVKITQPVSHWCMFASK